MKEAYRLNQIPLLQVLTQKKQSFSILFMYQAKTKMSFKEIEKAIKKAIKKFTIIHELD